MFDSARHCRAEASRERTRAARLRRLMAQATCERARAEYELRMELSQQAAREWSQMSQTAAAA